MHLAEVVTPLQAVGIMTHTDSFYNILLARVILLVAMIGAINVVPEYVAFTQSCVVSISDVYFSEQPHCCRVSDVRDEGYSLLG